MSFILAIGTATPPTRLAQPAVAEFMIRALGLGEEEARKLRALYRATGIDFRHTVVEDYARTGGFSFFPQSADLEPFPTTQQRMALYRQQAVGISEAAAREALQKAGVPPSAITHVVVVSCTGLYAPGLDIDLVQQLGLPSHVQRLAINFMGCYAAFNAMKVAHTICTADPAARVLVVCAELCSLHFQKKNTEDNWLANALFADGAAALVVAAQASDPVALKISRFHCELAPQGAGDMAWTVGDFGFEMRLSSYVPEVIRQGIGTLTQKLLASLSLRLSDIDYFAIHPGGKKILEAIEQTLGLSREQNQSAYRVLRQFGNMSSPTVLFVLQDVWQQLTHHDRGRHVLSFAFGPGLTLESMVFQVA